MKNSLVPLVAVSVCIIIYICLFFILLCCKYTHESRTLLRNEITGLHEKVSFIDNHLKKGKSTCDTIQIINRYPLLFTPAYLFDSIRNILGHNVSPVLETDTISKVDPVKVLHTHRKVYQSGEPVSFVITCQSTMDYFIRFNSSSPVYRSYHVDSTGILSHDANPSDIEYTFLNYPISGYYLKEELPGDYEAILTITKENNVVSESRIAYTISKKKIHVSIDSTLFRLEDHGNTKNIFCTINVDVPSRDTLNIELLITVKNNRDTLQIPVLACFPAAATSLEVNYSHKIKGRVPYEFRILDISIRNIIQPSKNVDYIAEEKNVKFKAIGPWM